MERSSEEVIHCHLLIFSTKQKALKKQSRQTEKLHMFSAVMFLCLCRIGHINIRHSRQSLVAMAAFGTNVCSIKAYLLYDIYLILINPSLYIN